MPLPEPRGLPFPADTVTFACSAPEDIEAEATTSQEVHACRKLLRDIEDVRASKIRKGTRMVMDEVKAKDHVHDVSSLINFRNLTFTELNNTRPTLTKALDTLADINPRTVSIRQHINWPLRPVCMLTGVLLARLYHRLEQVDKRWVGPRSPKRMRSLRRTPRVGSFAGTGSLVGSRCNRLASKHATWDAQINHRCLSCTAHIASHCTAQRRGSATCCCAVGLASRQGSPVA